MPGWSVTMLIYAWYLVRTPLSFTSPAFDPAKSIMPLWAWALLMAVVGVAGLVSRTRFVVAVVVALPFTWGVLLWSGTHDNQLAGGPAGWVPWVCLSLATYFGVRRGGTHA